MEAAYTKRSSLLRSTSLVSLMTFISRMTGFIRDILIAQLFGAEAAVDSFLVAFKIPNFMRRLFAEGAFSQAFVPVLAEYQQKTDFVKTRRFISHIAGNLLVILFIVTIIGCIYSSYVIRVFTPGFDVGASRFILASYMLKLTFPYLLLISMTALCGAVLNTYGRFAVPAFTPVLLNLSLMVAALWLAPLMETPIIALAWGVLIAGIAQLLFQLPFLFRARLLVLPRIDWHDKGVRRVLVLMVPALFGVSVAQVNLLLDTFFASFLPIGSVSWLYYSDRFVNFPLGVFGVAVATVILPHLSRQNVNEAKQGFARSLDWGIRLILLIAIPSMVSLGLFAKPIVIGLLAYGKFTTQDAIMTSWSLGAFALGVPGFMLVKVLASAFYSQQNIKTPVKVAAFSMVANTLLCLSLMPFLKHAGLALASSISGVLNAGLLLWLLVRRGIFQFQPGWVIYFGQLLFANSVLAIFLLYFHGNIQSWLILAGSQRVLYLLSLILGAMLLYIGMLYLVGIRFRTFLRYME